MKSIILMISLFLLAAPVYSNTDEKKPPQLYLEGSTSIITNSKQLTYVGPRSGEGYFSADGEKMIFQSEREPGNPFYQMYILDLKTSKLDRVSTGQGKTTCGWIHPDMKTVMWSSTHQDQDISNKVKAEYEERKKPVQGKYSWSFDEKFEIFSSDLKGKKIKQLTKALGYDAEGSYSPDGKYIAFASNRSAYDSKNPLSSEDQKRLSQDASYFMDIYIMKADGSDVKRLTDQPGYDGGPFFSADGKKLTWRRFNKEGTQAEIYTMNTDGSEQKQITHMKVMSWAPYFHPSGDYVIFTSSALGYSNFELFVVDTEGKNKPLRVSYNEGFDGLPTFSPDGKKISWTHKNAQGESQIYIADWNDQLVRQDLGLAIEKSQPFLKLSENINQQDIKNIVNYLAASDMKGRMTGSEEEKQYTQAISQAFQKWGLKPVVGKNYVQNFEFISDVKKEGINTATFKGNYNKDLKLDEDYQVVSYSKSGVFQPAPLVFVGYGIEAPATADFSGYNSYKDLDVQGKWVMLWRGTPTPDQRDQKKHQGLISYSGLQHKIALAKKNGASGVVIIDDKITPMKYDGALADAAIPVLRVSSNIASELFKQSKQSDMNNYENVQKSFNTYENKKGMNIESIYLAAEIRLKTIKSVGQNVVGILNPPKKITDSNKFILIGAHGDHLGYGDKGSSLATGSQIGGIHYGADDNASGVAGVMELAHYFSQNKKIKQPLVFAVWSGEEIGLLGSSHFVKNWEKESQFKRPLSHSFKAALNMDMIGHLGKTPQNSLFVQGIASAPEWTSMLEKVAVDPSVSTQMIAMKDPYLPTDSMALYLGNVPSISFFTGAHEFYHTPNDKAETLNYAGMEKIIQIVQLFVDELSQPQNKLTYQQVEGNSQNSKEGRSFKIYLGTIPDYSQEGIKGVKISGTSKNSPAEKAGLVAGDVIVEFDKTNIDNMYDYVYTLQTVKPNVKTNIKVLRNGKNIDLEIQPALKE